MKTNTVDIVTPHVKTSITNDSQSVQVKINNLIKNPKKFMTENRIVPSYNESHPKNTSVISTALSFNDEFNIFRFNYSDDQNNKINILYTKMRKTESEERFMAPDIVQIKENFLIINHNEYYFMNDRVLWLTTAQTGCSVLIIDYGKEDNIGSKQYSMIHMQPRNSDILENDLPLDCKCNTQEIFLEEDLAKCFKKIPVKYILIHSEEVNYIDDKSTQLVGISDCDGEFTFYKQLYEPCNLGEKNTVEKLEWKTFHHEQDAHFKRAPKKSRLNQG